MDKNNKIIVTVPKVINGQSVYCKFQCSGEINKYFKSNTFFVKYNQKIDSVPKSILTIPLLANICPLAWITSSEIIIEEIDKTFLEALESVKVAFQSMYPNHLFTGQIKPGKVINNKGYNEQKKGMFFSGGVDSLATFIRKRDEKPFLMTIWGSDINLSKEQTWNHVKNDILSFAKNDELAVLLIESNFRKFLNYNEINKSFAKDSIVGWWGSIQHGMGILGLCAPLTFIKGINTVYFASTYDKEYSPPWGSHPSIDNYVKWGNTQCIHDAFEINRQEKLRIISEYTKTYKISVKIRACYVTTSTGENCGNCEKCARTITGLLVQGCNPNHFGFKIDKNTLDDIRNNFETGRLSLKTKGQLHHWGLIRKKLLQSSDIMNSEYRDFFHWIIKSKQLICDLD